MTLAEALRKALEEPLLRYGIFFEVLHAKDQDAVALIDHMVPPNALDALVNQSIERIVSGNTYAIDVDPRLWRPRYTFEDTREKAWLVSPECSVNTLDL